MNYPTCGEISCEERNDRYEKAMDRIAELEAMVREWQPINTAPKLVDVLCLLESGRCAVLYLTNNGEGLMDTWRNLDGTAARVWPTHWMYIPKRKDDVK